MVTLSPIDRAALGKRFGFDYLSGLQHDRGLGPADRAVKRSRHADLRRSASAWNAASSTINDNEVPPASPANWSSAPTIPGPCSAAISAIRRPRPGPGATAGSTPASLMWRDAEGCFFFVDRKKDAIRRRGENMSSLEIEIEVTAHPSVRECAAYGVDLPGGEQEVMVAVAPVTAPRSTPANWSNG